MKKNSLFILFILFASSLMYSTANYSFVKELTIEPDQTHDINIISVKGRFQIRGLLKKSLIMIGGSIDLSGHIQGDLICVSAQVKIAESALIEGDLIVIGGSLQKDPLAKINGEFFFSNLKKIENSLLPFFSDSSTLPLLKFIKVILWLIIAIVIFAFLPERIDQSVSLFNQNPAKIIAVSFLSLFAFLFFLFLFVLMSLFIIGIPFLAILILGYFFIFIFGKTALYYLLGRKLKERFKLNFHSSIIYILLGVLMETLLRFIPYMGTLLMFVFNILAIGIGIAYFFRKRLFNQ
jgi:hypothetical protein